MGEKIAYGLLIGLVLLAVVMAAGCSGQSSPTTTPVPTTAPPDKYVAGDIAAKSATATDEIYLVLAYDASRDAYTRSLVYKNADGSWHRNSIANSSISRSTFEKLYPAKVAHVDLSSVPVVSLTVPPPTQITYSGAGPSVTNVTPGVGGKDTTVTLTISGSNFQNGATVKLLRGGSPTIPGAALSVSSSTITGTFDLTGADEGYYNIVVFNPDGQSATLAAGFNVGEPAPIIESVYPATGAAGETVSLTINGQNFGDVDTVSFSMGSYTIDPLHITNVQVGPGSKISCNLQIPDDTPLGDWSVTVLNVDAQRSGTWSHTFQITNSSS
ncbi:MAG TPA: IPT/TIG domain-containing protein [Methanoregula sp.]|nr:IPT/TIG domain-containing protein [Methanoregula sp.]